MRLYLRIPFSLSNRYSEALLELSPICNKIIDDAKGTQCFPVGGHTLKVIAVLNKHKIPFDVEVRKEETID
jgi:hypothetical protein